MTVENNDVGQTSLKAVHRTSEILRCLRKGAMTVTEIAEKIGITVSSAYRLLQTLEESGLLFRNKLNRRYYIGPSIIELLSEPNVTHQYLVSCASIPMEQLADFTGESVGLNVLVGVHGILLYEIPSKHELQIVGKQKVTSDLHAGPNYKVLLSQLNPKDLNIVVKQLSFKPLTEHTTTRKEELLVQLGGIREKEYAIGYGERIPQIMSISVPVKNYFVPVSLGILGPENRIKHKTAEFLKEIQEVRKIIESRISEALG